MRPLACWVTVVTVGHRARKSTDSKPSNRCAHIGAYGHQTVKPFRWGAYLGPPVPRVQAAGIPGSTNQNFSNSKSIIRSKSVIRIPRGLVEFHYPFSQK